MRVQSITSPSNPRIREVLKLKKKGRHAGRFLIEGPHLVETALRAGASISEAFVSKSLASDAQGRSMVRTLSRTIPMLFEVADEIMKRLADTETPQGVVAVAVMALPLLEDLTTGDNPLIVVADGVQDPGNLGTIIRTSDAAGARAVILLPGTCDAFSPKVVRATAGSIFHIPVTEAEKDSLLAWLRKNKIAMACTAADGELSLFDADLSGPLALVFGNEAHGVSPQIRKSADLSVRIPIVGKAESLNVASSVAVCLYEAVRQREGRQEGPDLPGPS